MEENKEILPDVKNIKTQETFTLPSKGLVYKPEDNIPASITLRRMTTREDKMRLRNQTEDRVRRDILQACILDPNVNAGKLKLMDANFLLFRLRAISLLDDIYKVVCTCPYCGTRFVHQVNLTEVPIEYLAEEKLAQLKMRLPLSKDEIDFKFPSLDDIINMGDQLRDYFERFPQADKAEVLYTVSTLIYIDKVNGHQILKEELEQYVDNLDIIDNRALADIISNLDITYGFVEQLETPCPNEECGRIVKHGLPITSELFTPSK